MEARVDENTRFVQVTTSKQRAASWWSGVSTRPRWRRSRGGSFTSFTAPDDNTWTLQQLPPPGSYDDAPQT